MQRRHIVHALLEIDVTGARRAIRAYRRALKRPLSPTTFVVACVARAIGDDPHMRAYRRGRKLVLFDDVDVTVTAIQMFGRKRGWGLPLTYHIHDGNAGEPFEEREYLALTLSVDYDVIDGAPAARFASRLKQMIESSDGIPPAVVRKPGTKETGAGLLD